MSQPTLPGTALSSSARRRWERSAALGGLLLGAACGARPAGESDEPRVRSGVLITLDTTDPAALDPYAPGGTLTPELARLAREGVVYERARSVAPLTTPAHASMLTGLYPPRHTVRDNGYLALPESAETLAERARAAGFRTGAFVAAAVLGPEYGLQQGFDLYDPAPRAGSHIGGVGERAASAVVEAAVRWLDARPKDRPYFLWVHTFEPHMPYAPAPEFLAKAGGDPYLGEVAAMDAALGTLLARLRAQPDYADTAIVLVADHGESRNRHGEATHGLFAYDATLHVPLIVRFPQGRRAGERSAATASIVDVFPTLLAAMGLSAPAGVDGVDLGAGDPPPERGVYFESYYAFLNYGWSPLAGWADGSGKYIHGTDPELFDAQDAAEERNVFAAGDARAERARAGIAALLARPRLERSAVSSGGASEQDLRALGYAAAGSALADVPEPLEELDLPAPRANLDEHYKVWNALNLANARRLEPAIAELRDVLATNPRNAFALDRLAEFLILAKRPREALEPLQALIDHGLERPTVRLRLAGVHAELGEYDRSLAHLERYLELTPGDAAAQQLAQKLRAATGQGR